LLAAYHFATGDDAIAQADHFLSVANGVPVLVLDFEKNTSGGPSMKISQAVQFVTHVQDKTGRSPVLYTGSFLKDFHMTAPPELTACPLWLSQYGPRAVLPLGFTTWKFWQYTDGHVFPSHIENIFAPGTVIHKIDGIGPCDCDLFNGNAQQLANFWAGK
jgi:lysozyme